MSRTPKTTTIYTIEQVVVENGERTRRQLPGEPVYRNEDAAENRLRVLALDVSDAYSEYAGPLMEANAHAQNSRHLVNEALSKGEWADAISQLLEEPVHEVEVMSEQDWVERQIEDALEGRGRFVYFEMGTLKLL